MYLQETEKRVISDCTVSIDAQSCFWWRVKKGFYCTPQQQALTPFQCSFFSSFIFDHRSSSASPGSWIQASEVLTSSRKENDNFWESSCCTCVFLAKLGILLRKSCTCWIASYCLNIPERLKLGFGFIPSKGPQRQESCPLFSLRAPCCLQPVFSSRQNTLLPTGPLGGWEGKTRGQLEPWPHAWVCLGNAVIAIDTGWEDTTASCPKTTE